MFPLVHGVLSGQGSSEPLPNRFVAGFYNSQVGPNSQLIIFDETGKVNETLETHGLPYDTYVNIELGIIVNLVSTSPHMGIFSVNPFQLITEVNNNAYAFCVHESTLTLYAWTRTGDVLSYSLDDLSQGVVNPTTVISSLSGTLYSLNGIAVSPNGQYLALAGWNLGDNDSDWIVYNTSDWTVLYEGGNSTTLSFSFCIDISDQYVVTGHQYNNYFTVHSLSDGSIISVDASTGSNYTGRDIVIDGDTITGIINFGNSPFPNHLVRYELSEGTFVNTHTIELPNSSSSDGGLKFLSFSNDKTKVYVSGNLDELVKVFSYPDMTPLSDIPTGPPILGPLVDIVKPPLRWSEPEVVFNYSVNHTQDDWGISALALKSPGYSTASYRNYDDNSWVKATLSDYGITYDSIPVTGGEYGDPEASIRTRVWFVSRNVTNFRTGFYIDGFESDIDPPGSFFPYPNLLESINGEMILKGHRYNDTQAGRVYCYDSSENSWNTIWTQPDLGPGESYYNSYNVAVDELVYIYEREYLDNVGNRRLSIVDTSGTLVDQYYLPSQQTSIVSDIVHNGDHHLFFISNLNSTTENIHFSAFNLITKQWDAAGNINYDDDLGNGWREYRSVLAKGQDVGISIASSSGMAFYVISMAEEKPVYNSMHDVSNAWFGNSLVCGFPMEATQSTLDTYFNGEGFLATIEDEYKQSFSAPISVVGQNQVYYASNASGPDNRLTTTGKDSVFEVHASVPENTEGTGISTDISYLSQIVLANNSINDVFATISVIRYEDNSASLVVNSVGQPLQTIALVGDSWVLGFEISDPTNSLKLYVDGVNQNLTIDSITAEPWLYFGLGIRSTNTKPSGEILTSLRTSSEQFQYTYDTANTLCDPPLPPETLEDQDDTYNIGELTSVTVKLRDSVRTGPSLEDQVNNYELGDLSGLTITLRESLIDGPNLEDQDSTYNIGDLSDIEVKLIQEIE